MVESIIVLGSFGLTLAVVVSVVVNFIRSRRSEDSQKLMGVSASDRFDPVVGAYAGVGVSLLVLVGALLWASVPLGAGLFGFLVIGVNLVIFFVARDHLSTSKDMSEMLDRTRRDLTGQSASVN